MLYKLLARGSTSDIHCRAIAARRLGASAFQCRSRVTSQGFGKAVWHATLHRAVSKAARGENMDEHRKADGMLTCSMSGVKSQGLRGRRGAASARDHSRSFMPARICRLTAYGVWPRPASAIFDTIRPCHRLIRGPTRSSPSSGWRSDPARGHNPAARCLRTAISGLGRRPPQYSGGMMRSMSTIVSARRPRVLNSMRLCANAFRCMRKSSKRSSRIGRQSAQRSCIQPGISQVRGRGRGLGYSAGRSYGPAWSR